MDRDPGVAALLPAVYRELRRIEDARAQAHRLLRAELTRTIRFPYTSRTEADRTDNRIADG